MIDLNNNIHDNKKMLTKEAVLTLVTDYQILSYYLGETPLLGVSICSPLRQDNVPSFAFFKHYNNFIYWKDHSTGEYGDCFYFIQKMFNLSFRQSLIKIVNDFQLPLFYKKEEEKGITILRRSIPKHKDIVMPKRYEIGVKIQKFTITDKEYWSQYNISSADLNYYNVYSVSHIFSGDRVIGVYNKKNPIYAYLFYKDGKYAWKIYKPKELDKRFKWMSNTNKSILQGWDQMPQSAETLLINKALKDVMVANKLGYAGVAMQSESQMIKPIVMDELKRRFKKIYILQDFDLAGVKNANQHYKKYGIKPIFLQSFKTRSQPIKDISDAVKYLGKEKAQKLLNNIII